MKKMLSKLLNPKKRIAGLDIGKSSVKVMEFEGDSLENAKLLNYAIEPIPENLWDHEKQLENIEELANVVKRCWKKAGITTRNVAIALPSSTVFSRQAIIPIFEEEEELNIHLENEIVKYGITPNEIVLDYSILGINEQSPTDYDMMLVVAKKEKIEERLAIVESAGLNPIILDIEEYALQNMVRLMKGEEFNNKTYLLLDASANDLRMLIIKKGIRIFAKDSSIGGMTLTKELIVNLGLTFKDAEQIKFERSDDITAKIIKKTFLNNYISEFKTALEQYYISSNNEPNIDEIILTGGVAGLHGIEDAFKEFVNNNNQYIKSEPYVARPLHNTPKSEQLSLNKFMQDEPGLFLVTSLALRPFLRQF